MVAGERIARLVEQLPIARGLAEPGAPPAGVEQPEHLLERVPAVGVVALEHLVDDDAEALVDGLHGGDAQHACELVTQRAAAVGVDVGGGQREADALARQERAERVLLAWRDRPTAPAERVVERGGLEDLALQRRGGGEQPRVDVGERLGEALPVGALQERGELEQLEVAHDTVGDVEVGVEPQLAESPADARDGVEHLVAQQPERGVDLAVGVLIVYVCVREVTLAVGVAGLH